ncbi:MAG: NAD(P)H-hydrate dehydratase [Kiloniellales bacterium]
MSEHPTADTLALLSVEEMSRADAAAIAAGVPGERLMEAAGTAIADEIKRRWELRPTVVLCGPGNNGGDGFVVARQLAEAGWPVRVMLLGRREELRGDAALNAGRWTGAVEPLDDRLPEPCGLIVDGLFGAGLARPIEGVARGAIEAINRAALPCVSIDVPSGVHGDSGAVLGVAPQAVLTVTFFRPKPGHYLLPGRALMGDLVVADIGIPDGVLDDVRPRQRLNGPGLWLRRYPWPEPGDHKYSRGHAVVVGGADITGAARLAARGAQRVGAGMVSLAGPPEAAMIYKLSLPGCIVRTVDDRAALVELVSESRIRAALIGPGNGVTSETRERALGCLSTAKPCVLDADALTVFADAPESLFGAIESPCLMTPHAGEFARLFGDDTEGEGKLARSRAAAAASGAVILFKGYDTVIAAADGRAVINHNAPPELATAGAGDVLAGFALGLLAQGMEPFDAACAAAWLQGAAASEFGPGLIAEDLAETLPAVLGRLKEGTVA